MTYIGLLYISDIEKYTLLIWFFLYLCVYFVYIKHKMHNCLFACKIMIKALLCACIYCNVPFWSYLDMILMTSSYGLGS